MRDDLTNQHKGQSEGGQYVRFLENRVAEQVAESRRYLQKYAEIRSFAYQMAEKELKN